VKRLGLAVIGLLTIPALSSQAEHWEHTGVLEKITALAVSEGHVFAGTHDGGVILSTDGGASWRNVSKGLPSHTTVEALAAMGDEVFVATTHARLHIDTYYTDTGRTRITNPYVGGVFHSTNSGSSWVDSGIGLPKTEDVEALGVCGGRLFAGVRNAGIYLSGDNGASWGPVNEGFPMLNAAQRSCESKHSGVFWLQMQHAGNCRGIRDVRWRPQGRLAGLTTQVSVCLQASLSGACTRHCKVGWNLLATSEVHFVGRLARESGMWNDHIVFVHIEAD
jgi:hypothetical protein